MKLCTKCKLEKSTEDFYADKRRSDGLKSWCKNCHNIGVRDWQGRNRTQDLTNKRTYIKSRRLNPEFAERERQAFAIWYDENREYCKQWGKSYRLTHPEVGRAADARRRARKKSAMQGNPKEVYDYSVILRNDPCSYCSKVTEAIDHIVPLSRGGDHDWTNMTASCKSCNSSKNNKSLLVWMGS